MFDWYGNIQLKVGACNLEEYYIGDTVEIEDGVYIGNEGVVVILNGKFAAEFVRMTTKWGHNVNIEEVLNPHILQAISEVAEENK